MSQTKFQPPTKQEAEAYAKSIGYSTFDYKVWYAYYATRGWHVGRTGKMRCWKSAIQTWFYRTDEYKAKKRKEQEKPKCFHCGKPPTFTQDKKDWCSEDCRWKVKLGEKKYNEIKARLKLKPVPSAKVNVSNKVNKEKDKLGVR
jgi:hypothetical protein